MWEEIKIRSQLLYAALNRTVVKICSVILAIVGTYDLFGAQFVSDKTAETLPRVYEIVIMTSGFLPWWGWLLAFMALVTLATIEYSVRRSRRSTRPILLKRGDITLHPNATEIDANSEYLPLQEAATLAYEQSKGSFVANHAEYNSELNDVIIWFCWALWKRIRIFVSKQPSRIIEEIYYRYKNRYDFTFQGEELILKQTMKHNYFNNLQVLSSELPEAISQIRSLGDNE